MVRNAWGSPPHLSSSKALEMVRNHHISIHKHNLVLYSSNSCLQIMLHRKGRHFSNPIKSIGYCTSHEYIRCPRPGVSGALCGREGGGGRALKEKKEEEKNCSFFFKFYLNEQSASYSKNICKSFIRTRYGRKSNPWAHTPLFADQVKLKTILHAMPS